MQQMVLLLLTAILGFFIPTPALPKKITIGLVFIFLLASISSYLSPNPDRAFTDLALYFSLFLSILILGHALRISQRPIIILIILALSPMLTLMWLPFNILTIIQQDEVMWVWHSQFINIRYFDDTLLPALFMLWYIIIEGKFSQAMKTLLSLVASLYLLALFLDGARAALLSCSVAFVIALAVNYKKLKLSYFYIVLSILLSSVFYFLVPAGHGFARNSGETSSGRSEMWLNALQNWGSSLQSIVLGSGGNPVAGYWTFNHTHHLMHPHNIGVQWLVEWGLAGILALILLGWICYRIFRQHQQIPLLTLAGAMAVVMNAFMSGSWVYPQSQITGLLLLAWAISFMPILKSTQDYSHNWLKPAVLLVLSAMLLSINAQNYLMSKQTHSDDLSNPPRFWLHIKN
jgi:O-antigen ligase